MDNSVFMTYDGDNAGRLVGQSVIADDVKALHEVSARIVHGHEVVMKWVSDHGGMVISQGGDEGTFQVPVEALEDIEQLRGDYAFTTNLTMTVGVGSSLSEAGKALLVGKFKGKNIVVTYDPSIEVEILEAQQRVADGTASEEERKLGEAYLKPKVDEQMENKSEDTHDCQYCQEMGDDPDHCKYCHDMDEEADCKYCAEAEQEEQDHEHTGDDCQYCQEAEAAAQEEHSHEDGSEADCEYCQEAAAQSNPEDFSSAGLDQPEIPKPDINDGTAPGIAHVMDSPSNSNEALDQDSEDAPIPALAGDAGESIYNPDENSAEAMQAIVAEISGEPSSDGQAAMDDIDDAEMPVDGSMEANVSRPEHYDENSPADMGLAEDEVPSEGPDLSGVLQEGLDNHADSIQKEKVIQMVGEALEGFKASKDVLEKAKEAAPQLYEASIAMLKAMIEMARMLGLGEESSEEPVAEEGDQVVSDLEQPNQEQGNEYPDNRPPAHFAHDQAAPAEGAPGKKTQGQ